MNDDPSRRRLGRGLAALIGEIDKVDKPTVVHKWVGTTDGQTPIEFIHPNPRNPRRAFGDSDLTDLAQSIKEHGIVQPVLVRPSSTVPGHYELIAGERRWRAAQRAGLTEVPIIVREVNDRTALELAIIENVQRTDLNPVEEALGYQQLIDDHSYTQADLGQVIGKSRSHVANTLRLLKLPDDIQGLVIEGALSAGHARTLVTAVGPGGARAPHCRRGAFRTSGRSSVATAGGGSVCVGAETARRERRRYPGIGKSSVQHHRSEGGDQSQAEGRRTANCLSQP